MAAKNSAAFPATSSWIAVLLNPSRSMNSSGAVLGDAEEVADRSLILGHGIEIAHPPFRSVATGRRPTFAALGSKCHFRTSARGSL